jgi:YHS domain-containing protein
MVKRSVFAIALLLSVFAHAAEKQLVNKDADGFALDRHDPVSFFLENKAVKGDPKIQTIYKGARYVFASREHKQAFDANPEKFIPQYGGYCAYGMSQGHTAPVKIETWQIVDGKLLLNYDLDVQHKFNKKQAEYIRKADENWPKVLDKEGK